jgi:hypothetical protein
MGQRRRSIVVVSVVVLGACLIGRYTLWAAEDGRPVKRARPPKWSADVLDAFFEDAREKLVGQRPDYGARDTAQVAAADSAGNARLVGGSWSKLIDAETIETEIKRIEKAMAHDVATPSDFKGGKYQDCRRHFSLLAMLFAVVAEYDGEVRWHDAAAGLRDVFARAGYNCKVGTDQTYREATQRRQDLSDLVNGSRPQLPQAERETDWSNVADRPPLMQRMNIAHQDRLAKWLVNEREFTRHRDDVHHEAQLIAAIADVIGREGFDYWDDEQYAAYARELKQSATDMAAAADQENFPNARDAAARMTKTCADCHEGYRG